MQRTPDTFPSYINDIGAEHDGVRRRHHARARALPRQRLRAERQHHRRRNGSNDAFYIKIDKHYGSSDHVTYMQHGIPAVMFITWPDMWYHSSEDTPDKQDPTQYKRAAVVGTGALAVIATAATRWPAASRARTSGAAPSGMGGRRAQGRRLPG